MYKTGFETYSFGTGFALYSVRFPGIREGFFLTGAVQVVDILIRFALKISGNLFKSSTEDAQITKIFVVTNNFPDGKFSRPRLAVFAFRSAQTKTSLRLPQTKNCQQWQFSLRLWTREDLNLRPLLCKSTALPTELRARMIINKRTAKILPFFGILRKVEDVGDEFFHAGSGM